MCKICTYCRRLLEQSGINTNGLVALALLIAESDSKQKDLMIRLIMNMLARRKKMNHELNTPKDRTKVKSGLATSLAPPFITH